MPVGIKFILNTGLYLKEPQESKLGKKIIKHSILLINELGFESFNFKKLAETIGSTEASIYRYFSNKHVLLIYLGSWYWEWTQYLIRVNTLNIEDPIKKVKTVISTIVSASNENPAIEFVNEAVLQKLVVAEGIKTMHTAKVENDSNEGFFKSYDSLLELITQNISEIDADFKYPKTLAIHILEMANKAIFFAENLPNMSEVKSLEANNLEIAKMVEYFTFKLLNIQIEQ